MRIIPCNMHISYIMHVSCVVVIPIIIQHVYHGVYHWTSVLVIIIRELNIYIKLVQAFVFFVSIVVWRGGDWTNPHSASTIYHYQGCHFSCFFRISGFLTNPV